MIVLMVALGAAVGAPLRYLVDRAMQARRDTLFPLGTFAVNAAGSFPPRDACHHRSATAQRW